MELSISDILEFDFIAEAVPTVLSGSEHLNREVRWVHSFEIPDITRFLSGGELLLTAGLGLPATDTALRHFVQDLAKNDVAALMIEFAGRRFARVPPALVREAKRLRFPIIGLEREVSFAQVSARVHQLMHQQRFEQYEFERELESTFSTLLLDNADSYAIVETLATLTGSTVVLENMSRQVLAFGSVGAAEFDLEEWKRHPRSHHDEHSRCARRPVIIQGQTLGWLHALSRDSHVTKPLIAAVERGATSVALSMVSERSDTAKADQRNTALITRVLLGDITGPEFIDRATRFGYQLNKERVQIILLNRPHASDPNQPLMPERINGHTLVAEIDNMTFLVTSNPESVQRRFASRWRQSHITGGSSKIASAASIRTAITQAKSAAATALSLPEPKIVNFDELGIERLLIPLAEGPDLANFVEDELGGILDHDAAANVPLLPTLRVYLSANGRKTEAATQLFIHRRSLYNRLDRITELVGADLDNAAKRQSLEMALKGLDILEASASSSSHRNQRWGRAERSPTA